MDPRSVLLLSAFLTTALVAGCAGPASEPDGEDTVNGSQPRELPVARFVASDYAFAGPTSLAGGPTLLSLTNAGAEWHVLDLFRITDDHTYEDAIAELLSEEEGQENESEPEWVEPVIITGVVGPGKTTELIIDLAPGTYVLFCWISDAEGVPHYHEGMHAELTVTERDESPVAMPEPALTLTLDDFSFAWDEAPTAGSHWVRVVNDGEQNHEAVIAELEEGADMAGFNEALAATFFEPDPNATEPPHIPGSPVGGVIDLEPGDEALVRVTFAAGTTYGLVCFIWDEESDTSHHELGMVHEFVVS